MTTTAFDKYGPPRLPWSGPNGYDLVMTMPRRPFAAVLLLAACYRYVPNTTAPITAGEELRLMLTPAASASLGPILGSEARAVEGRLSSVRDSGYVIAVSGTLKRGQGAGGEPTMSRTTWAGESVAIPRVAVEGVELRSLDARKTGLAVVLGTALAVVTVRIITHAIGSSGTGTEGGTVVSP